MNQPTNTNDKSEALKQSMAWVAAVKCVLKITAGVVALCFAIYLFINWISLNGYWFKVIEVIGLVLCVIISSCAFIYVTWHVKEKKYTELYGPGNGNE